MIDNQTIQPEQSIRPKPVVLIILDGWGIAADNSGNAILKAKTPNFDKYCREYFCTTLQASGEAVGLPYGEMGNSEVGHLNIGAGKIVYQDLARINKSITEKEFHHNSSFLNSFKNVLKNKSNLHLIGLLSTGGVHSEINHLYALLESIKEYDIKNVFVHAILDGRDMTYNSGIKLINDLEKKMKKINIGEIATISGRFWAMDRDNRWDRTKRAYETMTNGESNFKAKSALELIQNSYKNKVYDEEFNPSVIIDRKGVALAKISGFDSLIFFNFRADRMRQLVKAFVLPGFEKFERREYLKDIYVITLTQYDRDLPVYIAFPVNTINNPLAYVVSQNSLKQLHIAETEKYAHITYFINAGREEPFTGEDNILIPSPQVENYAKMPEMSCYEIKTRVIKEISNGKYDFIIINFANSDMVSHTGNFEASVKAVEVIDRCLGEIVDVALSLNGAVILTADHGNAENLINLSTGEVDKEHSTSPVPFILIHKDYKHKEESSEKIRLEILAPSGVLADVAPTILKIMNLKKPDEMSGRSLV